MPSIAFPKGYGESGNINTSTSSSTFVDMTGATLSVTTTGGRVWLGLISNTTTILEASVRATGGTNVNTADGAIAFVLETTIISTSYQRVVQFPGTGGVTLQQIPPSSYFYIDLPAAGSHNYKLQFAVPVSTGTLNIDNCKFVAQEFG